MQESEERGNNSTSLFDCCWLEIDRWISGKGFVNGLENADAEGEIDQRGEVEIQRETERRLLVNRQIKSSKAKGVAWRFDLSSGSELDEEEDVE